jgi:class 3 adenylate cyclase
VAGGRRVLYFDRRGIGYSQREVSEITEANQITDLESVISNAGLVEIDLVGLGDGCAVASAYAGLHPRGVRRLALIFPIGRGGKPEGLDALIDTNWGLARRAIVDITVGEVSLEDRRARLDTLLRAVTPEVAAQYVNIGYDWQPGAELSSIEATTLVVPHDGSRMAHADRARSLAAMIPGARFVSVRGQFADVLRKFLEGDELPAARLSPSTGLRTVLFTDIVGHTEMMRRLGDAKGRDVLREHERITRETLVQHGGAEIKTMGDGFLASFGSVSAAIECAIGLQRSFAAHSNSMPEPLHVRVGLNAGEPIEEEGDLFGSTVIMASRIAAQAGAGEILLPETLRHLLSGKSYVYADRGETTLKGFEDAVRLYEVRWRE